MKSIRILSIIEMIVSYPKIRIYNEERYIMVDEFENRRHLYPRSAHKLPNDLMENYSRATDPVDAKLWLGLCEQCEDIFNIIFDYVESLDTIYILCLLHVNNIKHTKFARSFYNFMKSRWFRYVPINFYDVEYDGFAISGVVDRMVSNLYMQIADLKNDITAISKKHNMTLMGNELFPEFFPSIGDSDIKLYLLKLARELAYLKEYQYIMIPIATFCIKSMT